MTFVLFALSNGNQATLVLGVIVYSAGEILTIPAIDIAIDRISTPENKTLYFGLSEFRTIGFTLGPIFASIMLKYAKPFWMFIALACIIFFSTALFLPKRKLSAGGLC
jgi:MFS family permease